MEKHLAQAPEGKRRCAGIDVIKLLSMQMIVVLHVLGQGGILSCLPVFSVRYEVMWLLETACFCAVNCFALATGYLMAGSRFRYSRLLELWLQVAFYTVGLTALFALLVPGSVTPLYWKMAFFPMTTLQYWYFTAYFAMFLFIPFFNRLLEVLKRRELERLILSAVLLSLLTVAAGQDIFRLHNGYSMLWLSALYFIGAYFKKYPFRRKIPAGRWLLGYGAMVLVSWGEKWIAQRRSFALTGEAGPGGTLINYVSPTMLLAAVFLFLACLQLEFKSQKLPRLFSRLAPAAFGVYLIHCQVLVWHRLLADRFAALAALPAPLLLAAVLAAAAGIDLVCLCADLVRIRLFRMLGIGRLCQKAEALCGSLLGRWRDRMDTGRNRPDDRQDRRGSDPDHQNNRPIDNQ